MSRRNSTASLEPPRRSVELQDPGAHELESSDEFFSDASDGQNQRVSRPQTPSSPIPKTRVERVDDSPAHGEVPGTPAYEKRKHDAVPDELEILPERSHKRKSSQFLEPPTTPGGSNRPVLVVEKVDPDEASYGDVPGTEAYDKRIADAPPDIVLKAPDPGATSRLQLDAHPPRFSTDNAIPETVVTPVDSPMTKPRSGTEQDGSPTPNRSMNETKHTRRRSTMVPTNDDFNEQDDFDDFEEGAEADADDDFGDFDDGFEEPATAVPDAQDPVSEPSEQIPAQSFPLIDSESLSSLPDLIAATQIHLDAMFPNTTEEKVASNTQSEPIPADSPIFPTERSRSLWKQLVTPPPLQPPNWTQSRIRRLFLISLGVPVDLDEILPPSKQKKLVLPDINLEPSRKSESDKQLGSIARLKARAINESTGSVDSNKSAVRPGQHRKGRDKGPLPPPDLDLTAVKRLCATTNEKIDGFDDQELQNHVKELELLTERTSEVLEYWLKRRDGVRKEKEAFEGVIENLVRHARRVRQ